MVTTKTVNILNTPFADGDVPVWNSSTGTFEPANAVFTAGGDLVGSPSSQQVVSLTGDTGVVSIPTAALAFGASPAQSGEIRLSDINSIFFRNSLDTGDIVAMTCQSNSVKVGHQSDVTFLELYSNNTLLWGTSTTSIYNTSGSGFAMSVGPASIKLGQPLLGSNDAVIGTPFSVHGGVTLAFASDADYTVVYSIYAYDWNEYTNGSWTTDHSVIYPAPSLQTQGYYKTINNDTSYTITVSTGSGTTQTLASGNVGRFWFDNNGVSKTTISSSSFTAGGDLTGSSSSQQVVTLTGSGGLVNVPSGTSLTFGTAPATAGVIRLENNTHIRAHDVSNTFDYSIAYLDTSSYVTLGEPAGGGSFIQLLASGSDYIFGSLLRFNGSNADVTIPKFSSANDGYGKTTDYLPTSVQTTDDTLTPIFTTTMLDGTVIMNVVVDATQDDNTQSAAFIRTACFKSISGTVTQISTTQDGGTFADDPAWLADVTTDGTNLIVNVTGVLATNITWTCIVSILQVKN